MLIATRINPALPSPSLDRARMADAARDGADVNVTIVDEPAIRAGGIGATRRVSSGIDAFKPVGSGRGNRPPVSFLTKCQKTALGGGSRTGGRPLSCILVCILSWTQNYSIGRKREEIDADQ